MKDISVAYFSCINSELKNQKPLYQSFKVNPEMHPEIPSQVDNFTNLCPLESTSTNLLQKSHTFGYVTTVYKVVLMY